jgi:hypothetical protein
VLHDRLADTDLIVLLDTPTAPESKWVREELDLVHQLGVGVFQLSWPALDGAGQPVPDPANPTRAKTRSTKGTEFSARLELQPADFATKGSLIGPEALLTPESLRLVSDRAEQARIRSLAARRERVISYLRDEARRVGLRVITQPGRPVELRRDTNDELVATAFAIPGLPDAWEIYRREREIAGTDFGTWDAARYKTHRIVFDGLGILGERRDFLEYLNGRLYLQTVATQGILGWFGAPTAAQAAGAGAGAAYVTPGDVAAQAGAQKPADGRAQP